MATTLGERNWVFRPGDRVRVHCSGLTFEGTMLGIRADGFHLCQMDDTEITVAVDPTLVEVELLNGIAARVTVA